MALGVSMQSVTRSRPRAAARINTLLVSLAFWAASCWALDPGSPASAGFISERLKRIDRAVLESIADGEIAGAVALVARGGEIVYHKPFGYADIDSQAPMRNDAIFRIASMTKAVTTVAVMMLYEEGEFALNDPISDFIPGFAEPRVILTDDEGQITGTRPAVREIRIIDLLTHSSGIGYPFIPSALAETYRDADVIDGLTVADRTLGDNIEKLAGLPLLFDPGSELAYGLSTDVLGYLVEVVSGQPLDRFFADRIFGPLGMGDTYFYLPEPKAGRLVTLYAHVAGRGLVESRGDEADLKMDSPNYPVEGARTYFCAGAGLTSTAFDYSRLLQMLLNEGELDGVRLLGRKSVELMRAPRIDWDGDDRPDFALGFEVIGDLGTSHGLASPGAYSWGGAFNTSYWIDPAEDLIGVFMSQARPVESDITKTFRTMVYQALE
jgi:CubicO group peptidase (beta-lactamase class C family)